MSSQRKPVRLIAAASLTVTATICSIIFLQQRQNWSFGQTPEDVIPNSKPASEYFEREKVTEPPLSKIDERPAVTVAAILHDNGVGGLAEFWTLNTFEDELEEPLLLAKIGRWVGHESGGGERTIFYEGTDAEKMFRAMIPRLRKHDWASGSYLIVNYGKPSFQRWRIPLPLKRTVESKEDNSAK